VTIGFVATRHFPARDALGYVPAQLLGAVLGALVLRAAWDGTPAELGATVPTVGAGSAFTYELVMTAFLMFVIVAVATTRGPPSPSAAPSRSTRSSVARSPVRR
jgi:glycerol uptake facilitator-like aquaporin